MVLERWIREFNEWKVWFAKWQNRREPGLFTTRARRQPPETPAWLPEACTPPVEGRPPLAEACRIWRDWVRDGYANGMLKDQQALARSSRERSTKSMWWEHVHLDALWPMTQVGSKAFGVFGTHATMPLGDRVQVFVAPGAILMRLPALDGTQEWNVATDWGMSFRLADVRLPGVKRPAALHINLARVWLLGSQPTLTSGDLYLAGLSLTFKQR